MASAAAGPPSGERPSTAAPSPPSSSSTGSGTPITPVESTSTCSSASPSSRAVAAAVACASRSPCSPVAAFAFPELTTTACGCARSRCSFERTTGAACMRLTVNIPAPVAGAVERTSARSFRVLRIPQCTPLATKPCAAVTLTPRTPLQPKPGGLLEAEREVRVLHGLPRRSLAEVVERADHDRLAGGAILEHAELCGVRLLHARELRRDALGEQVHDPRAGVRLVESRAHLVRVGCCVTGDDQPSTHRQQVRDEAHGEPEHLLDLGRVLVRPHAVRRDVLEHEARVRRLLQPAPRARHAGLGVDDDARRFEEVGHRSEREQRRRRVAPGVRDQRPGRRRQLRHRVAPLRERVRVRVLEAVPLARRGRRRPDGARRRGRRRRCRPERRAPRPPRCRGRRRRRPLRPGAPRRSARTPAGGRSAARRGPRRPARRASPSPATAAPARGAPGGGRVSPGRRTRRHRGWLRSASA